MEMAATGGRDGDHEQTNSISYSSSSGTIVSTQTTYTSRGSRLSSFSIEAAMHLDLEPNYYDGEEEEETDKEERVKTLLQELLGAPPPSANCSGGGVLERWFTELGVAWVLHLNLADGGGASAGILEHTSSKTRSWIRALAEITDTIRFTASLFPDHAAQGLPSIFEDEEDPEANEHCFPDQFNDIGRSIQQEPEARILEHAFSESWIRALAEIEITDTIRFTASLFPDHASQGLPSIFEDEEEDPEANEHCFPDQFNDIGRSIQQEPEASEYYFPDQFKDIEPFIQESMSKMLSFVDIIVALDPVTCESFVDNGDGGVPALYSLINILLSVHNALLKSLSQVRLVFHSPPSPHVERMMGEIVSLLSAKNSKAGEAIWSTLEQIRMEAIEDGDNSSTSSQNPQAGSSDIHSATRSVMGYIMFLRSRYSSMVPIVSQASRLGKYVPQSRQVPLLISLVIEMVSYVEEKLANKSESFQDQALMFLFLLNNSNFIRKYLINYPFPSHQGHMTALIKVDSYMESYLQLSWAPVLSCLLNPTPLFFGRKRNSSPLSKFESEFQKVYNTQKLWKVPDPELRKTLRKAIAEKIIPGYTKYIKDYRFIIMTTPKFSPQMLEDMLQEIFEG